ncbi:MAG: carboxypeptidase-like regulatory domain-containing protein, partial [Acidobacteria bacterium]|nr:carboxypeptidase-like regulatory domain-containing protein [Acidobacteriota bacterium]
VLASWVFLPLAPPAQAQVGPITGYITGKVYDRDGKRPLKDAIVVAQLITSNQVFSSGPADGKGNFIIRNAESGVYAFVVIYQGKEYAVPDRLDARVRMITPDGTETPAKMTFLLEVCFRRDRDDDTERTALVVRDECKSELPSFLTSLVEEGINTGLIVLIAGGAAVAATVGILAATGGEVASNPSGQQP